MPSETKLKKVRGKLLVKRDPGQLRYEAVGDVHEVVGDVEEEVVEDRYEAIDDLYEVVQDNEYLGWDVIARAKLPARWKG